MLHKATKEGENFQVLDLKLQGPTCVVLSFDLLWNHTQMLPPMIDILVIVPPFTVICFENSLNYCVKFPHSPMPILHYAFSSWIEKTMTKTIHCHWENRFALQQYEAVQKFYQFIFNEVYWKTCFNTLKKNTVISPLAS